MSQEIELVRDCSATVIPSGQAVTLPKGAIVYVAQTLGGNVTVRTSEGLFRISALDVDALGGAIETESAAQHEGEFGEEAVWAALKTCYDPEIPVNIVDLGLVYDLSVEPRDAGRYHVDVKMTLTAQGCGMGPVIADDARAKIEALDDVESANVMIVWDPVWNPAMISDEGRKILGLE